MQIVIAALILAAMGLIFGLVLTFTSKIFEVQTDPKRDAVRANLPGANCGGCGYPGCDGCADAIAAGKAPVNACPVASDEAQDRIAAIMGVESPDDEPMVCRVLCQGTHEAARIKFEYVGIQDCVAASTVGDGYKACKFSCLGLGTCVRACHFDAIHIDPETGIAVVDEKKCTACGACVDECPHNVLAVKPVREKLLVRCRNTDKLKAVMDVCKAGCIGCQKCAKTCPSGAITMVNNLPVIDMEKCVACGACVEACPTHVLKLAD